MTMVDDETDRNLERIEDELRRQSYWRTVRWVAVIVVLAAVGLVVAFVVWNSRVSEVVG